MNNDDNIIILSAVSAPCGARLIVFLYWFLYGTFVNIKKDLFDTAKFAQFHYLFYFLVDFRLGVYWNTMLVFSHLSILELS